LALPVILWLPELRPLPQSIHQVLDVFNYPRQGWC